MATDVMEETKRFGFNQSNLEKNDVYFLDYKDDERGQIVIVVTGMLPNGRVPGSKDIMGLATDRSGRWCGPYGRILFRGPIELGKKTDATFNNRGGHPKRLEVTPTKLVRVRDGKHEHLLH